jgi:hypothetical protein
MHVDDVLNLEIGSLTMLKINKAVLSYHEILKHISLV